MSGKGVCIFKIESRNLGKRRQENMSEEKLQAHKLFLDLLSSLSLPLTCHCLSYFECQQQGQKFVPPFMASPTVVNNTCQEPIGAQFFLTFQEFCTLRQSGNSVTDPWQPDGSERSFSGFIHGVQDPFIIFHYPKSILVSKQKDFTSLLRTVPSQ